MTAHIRIDKELEEDTRVWRLGSLLFELLKPSLIEPLDVTRVTALHGVTRNAVLGGLVKLWRYADTHIASDNVLPAALHELAEVTLLPAELLRQFPPEWLIEHDDGSVELPDYVDKNALTPKEKRRAQTRERVRKWREKHRSKTPDSGNALHVTRNAASRVRAGAGGRGSARVGNPIPEPVPEPRERDARDVTQGDPRGTGEVQFVGDNLTRSQDEWRGVANIDANAFEQWLPHLASKGIRLSPEQRVIQAEELAANGGPAEQREVVRFCIGRDFKGLIPIVDVRARRNGMSRNGSTAAPKQSASERDAADPRWPTLRDRGSTLKFREPYAHETADVYETQLRLHERSQA